MTRTEKIYRQAETLLEIGNVLEKGFNPFRGAVQFFQSKRAPELFVFQLKEAHIADVGRLLMQISFLVRMEYALLDGFILKGKGDVPADGRPPLAQYKDALKHVYINIRLDPWLRNYIFSRTPKELSPFQDIFRLSRILREVSKHLPALLNSDL